MAVITTAGSGNWNAGGTWTGGSVPGDADEAHIDSGHTVTMTANAQVGNLVLDGGQITGAGYKITLVKTSGRLCDLSSGTISGNLDLELQGTHTTTEDFMPTTGNLRSINLNGNANQIVTTGRNTVITGTMTVSAGVLITGNDDFTADLVNGNNGTVKTGSGTYTSTSNDWRVGTTQFQVDGGDFAIGDQMGGTWDCNNKQADIACKRFHSTVSMTNGTSLISDNTAEDVIVTATAGEANSSVYGPLQGRINLVTNSSGSKDFELKEDLEVNGRIVVSGSGEFRTYTSSNTFDLLVDGATFHNSNGGSAYSCLDVLNSAKFLSGSSNVMLDVALGSNLCDIGEFNGTDGQAVTGWTPYGNNTILYDSNSAKITYVDNSTGAYFMLNSTALSISELTVGKVYKCTFDAKINTGSVNLKWTTQNTNLPFGANSETHASISGATTRNETLTNTSYEKRVAYFVAGFTSVYLYVSNMSSGEVVHIDNMTVQEVMANGSIGSAGHKKSYGLDISSTSTACNLGTGFYYSCGTRFAGQNHTKTSGRYCAGSGDSTEYFSGGGNSLSFGTTDIIFLANSGATNAIGWNVSTTTWDCRGFYFYSPVANQWQGYWNHDSAPTINSPSSSTATKIHTYDCDMFILKGMLRTQYPAADKYSVGIVCTGHVRIYDDGELETHQDAYNSGLGDCDHSFGTLTANDGGTYKATKFTTTITSASGGAIDNRAFYIHTGATFDHNRGLIKFTASSPQVAANSSGVSSTNHPFYDIENTAGTIQWKGEHNKVLNNATIRGSQFNGGTGNLTVLGTCRFTAGTFNDSDTSTRDTSYFKNLVIESGATVDLSALDITVGSIRNKGGTING